MAPLLFVLCIALGVVDAAAQAVSPPRAPTAKLPAAATPTLVPASEYVVGPQDVLNITVYGEPQLSGRIRVDNDGSFPVQYLGRIRAEGLTTAQIEKALREGLGDGYLRNPQVSVEVIEYRSQSVFVTGEVRLPNKYSLPGNSTLMDVLTLAGSVTSNAGPWVQITHARAGVKGLGPAVSPEYDVRVNLRDIQTGKAQNVQVQDGDTIFVPKSERVWVVGQVRNSGGIPFEEGMTVFQAISAAGGVTEKGSNNRVEIIRIENGQRRSYNAKPTDIVKPGDQVNVKPRRL
jgi:polysaccharide export outer membrane protein